MKYWKKVCVGVASLFVAFSLKAMDDHKHEPIPYNKMDLSFRDFCETDREWAVEEGVKSYLQTYEGRAYFVKEDADYPLIYGNDIDWKKKSLAEDGKKLIDLYLGGQVPNCRPLVLTFKEEEIGGIFYRWYKDIPDFGFNNNLGKKALVIDDFVFTKPIDENLEAYILTDFLRELEPDCKHHAICVRPINTKYLELFTNLEFKPVAPREVKQYGYDPLLYTGLLKEYQ